MRSITQTQTGTLIITLFLEEIKEERRVVSNENNQKFPSREERREKRDKEKYIISTDLSGISE